MAEEIIRVGIVGAGGNTRSRHIPGLQAISGVEIVSVCNRNCESSERAASEFGIPKIYIHPLDLIAAPDTNAIVIGTWPYMHCPLTLAALAADKHVMCEARMAMNAEEARTMRDAARAKPHLTTQIVPAPMTLHVDSTIRQLLADGYLGDVLTVEVQDTGSFLDADAPLQWRQDSDLSGLNIMTMGIWYESLMRWVGEAASVYAKGQTFVKMRKDDRGILTAVRIPEHLDITAEMVCDAQLHMQISRVMGFSEPPSATLYGSEGTLRFTQGKLFGGRKGEDGLEEIPTLNENEAGWRVEEEFVNAIRGRESITHTDFDTGVKYMEFTDAIARSMAERREISIF